MELHIRPSVPTHRSENTNSGPDPSVIPFHPLSSESRKSKRSPSFIQPTEQACAHRASHRSLRRKKNRDRPSHRETPHHPQIEITFPQLHRPQKISTIHLSLIGHPSLYQTMALFLFRTRKTTARVSPSRPRILFLSYYIFQQSNGSISVAPAASKGLDLSMISLTAGTVGRCALWCYCWDCHW